jgi:UDP-glucose 4-epimerase
MENIIKQHNIQYISHQAARASVTKSVEDPLLTNDININGTLNLLRLAKEHNIQKFVCAISSSVYGNTEKLPKVETMPYHPESPYAITKVAKEMHCKTFYSLYGLPTIGLRYFNVYGPRQDPQ